MPRAANSSVVAAIDVGTNAVRLELAQRLPNGGRRRLYQERDPIRPGEGVFRTGKISPRVANRLMRTLRRYAGICKRYDARVRAVATSALREARNRDEIVRRARDEAGVQLEVISGTEEARLICAGVLEGRPASTSSLCIDIGGGSTEVARAVGDRPKTLWSVALGSMRLTELFELQGRVRPKQLDLVREYAMETIEQGLRIKSVSGDLHSAFGSSGSIKAVVAFAARGGKRARLDELSLAIEELAEMSLAERKQHMDPSRASVIVAGSSILEALMLYLKLDSVRAVDRGLREGVLIDLVRRQEGRMSGASLEAAALRIGRKLRFDESHARQVRRIALQLFDDLASLHGLPATARPLLDAAALLHDIGKAVSDARHHKHSYYLLSNVNIAGMPDREREIAACIARYHDRSPPDVEHAGMRGLGLAERQVVRRLATLLRVADSLDCSHHQAVLRLQASCGSKAVTLRLKTRSHADLELWDSAHEAPLFQRVFGRKLVVRVG